MGLWCIECSNANKNDFDIEKMICKRCKSNNVVNVSGKMKVFDILTITSISKDKNFLKAMSDLYDTDIIEYNVKMTQFKTQVEQQKRLEVENYPGPKCPTCNNINIARIPGISKAVDGALFGIYGTKWYRTFHCNHCGYEW